MGAGERSVEPESAISVPSTRSPARGFQPGTSGNPKGRPVGTRSRLGAMFLTDILRDWEEHGVAAITAFRTERPHEYVKVVASLLPRELNVKVNELDEFSDEQITEQLSSLVAQLAAAGADPRARSGESEAAQPTLLIPPLR